MSDDSDIRAMKAAPSIEVRSESGNEKVLGDPVTISREQIKDPAEQAWRDVAFDELVKEGLGKERSFYLAYAEGGAAWRAEKRAAEPKS